MRLGHKFLQITAMLMLPLGALMPAFAESVSLTGRFPAEYPEVSFLRRLAVDRIAGRDGAQLQLALERALASVSVDGVPFFSISAGGNVDGIVSGVASTSIDNSEVDRERDRCAEKASDGKCTRHETIVIKCRQRVIDMTIDLRIVRTRDDKIVYSQGRPQRTETVFCPGDTGSQPSTEQVVRDAISAAAAATAREIAPYTAGYSLRFYESRDRMPKEIGQRFKIAMKQTKGDLPGACSEFAAIDRDFPDHFAVVYDLGICAEARGEFEAASALYQRAAAIRPRDRADFDQGIDRTARLIRAKQDAAALAKQR